MIIKLPGITSCRAGFIKKERDVVGIQENHDHPDHNLLLLTAGYMDMVYTIYEHFLTGINGKRIQLFLYMTVSQSEELRLAEGGNIYFFTIDTRNNGQESITLKQVGLSYDSDGSVDKLIRNQDRFTWFLAFNQHRNYEFLLH